MTCNFIFNKIKQRWYLALQPNKFGFIKIPTVYKLIAPNMKQVASSVVTMNKLSFLEKTFF